MTRALSTAAAKEELQRVHELSSGNNDVSLYKCLQRQEYYWPKVAKEAAKLHSVYPRCQEPLDTKESLFIQSAGDWREPYLDISYTGYYYTIALKSSRFFLEEGHLSRRGFN